MVRSAQRRPIALRVTLLSAKYYTNSMRLGVYFTCFTICPVGNMYCMTRDGHAHLNTFQEPSESANKEETQIAASIAICPQSDGLKLGG